MARDWYAYTGPVGSEGIIGNYVPAIFDVGYCIGGPNLCAIYAVSNGDLPRLISQNLKNYIAASKASNTYFPNGLNEKPYVYSRT